MPKKKSFKTVLVDSEKLFKDIKQYMIENDLIFAKSLYRMLGFKDYQGFYYFRRKVQNGERVGIGLLKKVCNAIGKDVKDYIKEG